MITIYNPVFRGEHKVKTFKFPGGELQVKIPEELATNGTYFHITAYNMSSSDDIMELLLTTNALGQATRDCPGEDYISEVKIGLTLAYTPYARQDRVCNTGEALSIKVFADLINSQRYHNVTVVDPHSDVAPTLIHNCHIRDLQECFQVFRKDVRKLKEPILVSPDAGANKKVFNLSKYTKLDSIRADKTRDVKTGNITGTQVYTDHVGDRPFIVVDDICDGGRTFVELGKILKTKTNGPLILYVTHGIFSNGFEELLKHYDEIWVYNPFVTELPDRVYTGDFGCKKIELNLSK